MFALRRSLRPVSKFAPSRSFALVNVHDSKIARDVISHPEGLKVVNWTAPWCGPCKMVAPVIQQLSDDNPEVHFYKIDVDDCSDVASEAGVNSMPTFHFIKGDQVVDQLIGADSEQLLEKFSRFSGKE